MKGLFHTLLVFAVALPLGAQTNADFLASVRQNFARWDLNHDGRLTTNELDAAVADPQNTNQAAAAVAALKRASRQKKISLPPLTPENLAALAERKQPDLQGMFRDALARIGNATNRALFAKGLPALTTIHQGELGNCFCLAPLGALVHHDPAAVTAMFSPETNGNYEVRLGRQIIEVTPPTDAELALTSANEGQGIWVNVYEKAVGTARRAAEPPDRRAGSILDALARGGSAGTMLAFITGDDITRFSFKFAKDPALPAADFQAKMADLRQQLAAAEDKHILMTCGTLQVTTPGLTPDHAYAVLGYHADRDSVELWNPHGQHFAPKGAPGADTGYPTVKGVFEIPLAEFVRQFSGMAFKVVKPELPGA